MDGHITAANASNSYSPYMHAKIPLFDSFSCFGISAFAALYYQLTTFLVPLRLVDMHKSGWGSRIPTGRKS